MKISVLEHGLPQLGHRTELLPLLRALFSSPMSDQLLPLSPLILLLWRLQEVESRLLKRISISGHLMMIDALTGETEAARDWCSSAAFSFNAAMFSNCRRRECSDLHAERSMIANTATGCHKKQGHLATVSPAI